MSEYDRFLDVLREDVQSGRLWELLETVKDAPKLPISAIRSEEPRYEEIAARLTSNGFVILTEMRK